MRFKATFRVNQHPELTGCLTLGKKFNHDKNCFEFNVSDVNVLNSQKTEVDIILIARKSSNSRLYGPASSRLERSIIYPCSNFRCRVDCPCQRCRCKVPFCPKADAGETCCGECANCYRDLDNHLHFHRTLHLQCKFCANLLICIPKYRFFVFKFVERYDDHRTPISLSLFRHKYIEHYPDQGKEAGHPCDKCEHIFKKKEDLKRHEMSQHFENKYSCVFCKLAFTRSDNLEQHVKSVHRRKNSPGFECSVCKLKFDRKSTLNRHGKDFRKCEECFQLFCTLKQLQSHKRNVHFQFSCQLCKKAFTDTANLSRHTNEDHLDCGDKNNCEICGVSFCTLLSLLKHRKELHKPSIQCNFCSKTFRSNVGFKVHIDKREEMLCDICGQCFCNNYDFKLHLRCHSKMISFHNTNVPI